MKDILEPGFVPDDIDRIVDALLQNPSNAGDIKVLLRNKLTAPDTVSVARAAMTGPTDDDDDLWDNVPV